jgi:mannosyltransferase OCH1-like enzyme
MLLSSLSGKRSSKLRIYSTEDYVYPEVDQQIINSSNLLSSSVKRTSKNSLKTYFDVPYDIKYNEDIVSSRNLLSSTGKRSAKLANKFTFYNNDSSIPSDITYNNQLLESVSILGPSSGKRSAKLGIYSTVSDTDIGYVDEDYIETNAAVLRSSSGKRSAKLEIYSTLSEAPVGAAIEDYIETNSSSLLSSSGKRSAKMGIHPTIPDVYVGPSVEEYNDINSVMLSSSSKRSSSMGIHSLDINAYVGHAPIEDRPADNTLHILSSSNKRSSKMGIHSTDSSALVNSEAVEDYNEPNSAVMLSRSIKRSSKMGIHSTVSDKSIGHVKEEYIYNNFDLLSSSGKRSATMGIQSIASDANAAVNYNEIVDSHGTTLLSNSKRSATMVLHDISNFKEIPEGKTSAWFSSNLDPKVPIQSDSDTCNPEPIEQYSRRAELISQHSRKLDHLHIVPASLGIGFTDTHLNNNNKVSRRDLFSLSLFRRIDNYNNNNNNVLNQRIPRDRIILYHPNNLEPIVIKISDLLFSDVEKEPFKIDNNLEEYPQLLVTDSKIKNSNNSTTIMEFSNHADKCVHNSKSTSGIPPQLYTCWHTKNLPLKMSENYNSLVSQNPEIQVNLFDEPECRDFISKYFDSSVLEAYDMLIPSSYKSDLWRYCVLHKNGGIYMDIKYNCANGFKLINLCDKEHFVMERSNASWEPGSFGLYTALIVVKPYNETIGKCIKQIVENVKTRFYGFNALYPTGPGLLGSIYFKTKSPNVSTNDIDMSFSQDQKRIIYNKNSVLEVYPEYRSEQFSYQNNVHYSLLWENSNIYKLLINHTLKRDVSAGIDSSKKNVLVVCHIGNFDVFEKMRHYISFVQSVRNKYNVDIFFNLINGITSNNVTKLNVYFPEANIIISDNYGFDIGSFFHTLDIIKSQGIEYDYVLKIHTKTDDMKRFNVLNNIVSSPDKIMEILHVLDTNPIIGCVSSNRSFQTDDFTEQTRNKNHLTALLSEFELNKNNINNAPFPAGCMFWMKFDILKNVYMNRDLMKICQSLNTEYKFDYNWFYFAYYNAVNKIKNPVGLYNYYWKNRTMSRNLFEAINANSAVKDLRDGMIEHAHERMFAYAVDSCQMKIYLA